VAYSVLMYLLVPLFLWRLFHRGFRDRQYWYRWSERFGFSRLPELMGSIWIHAVSVGEVQASVPLIEYFLRSKPQTPVVITTMTPTGSQRVISLFGNRVYHVYSPYDLSGVVSRFLNRINPARVVIMETEIWPNIIGWCYRRQVPLLLANARLSERSAERYRRIRSLAYQAISRISCIAAQTESDRLRFMDLGAAPEQVIVTGNIKMDTNPPAELREQGQVIRRRLGVGRSVWIAASTHAGEEEQILEAYAMLKKTMCSVLLVLIPRHPERSDEVERLCRKNNWKVIRHTQDQSHCTELDIYLVDTLGELPQFFCAGDVAFIGGSLVPVGGHNMIEASAQGIAVVFGPHLFNFHDISHQLLQADAARMITDSRTLALTIQELLKNADLCYELGRNGRAYVESNRGALQRLIEIVVKY